MAGVLSGRPVPEVVRHRRSVLFHKRGSLGLRAAPLSLACFLGPLGLLWWHGFPRGGGGRPQRRGCRHPGLSVGGVQGSSQSLEPALPLVAVAVPTERMSSARDTDFEKQHLWMYLQALGLDPSPGVTVGWKMVSHAHLGE